MTLNEKRINYPLLKGRQEVAGIWLPISWFNEAERRRLIIKNWHSGCSAYRFPEGDLIQFDKSVMLFCQHIEGWPLLRFGSQLYSANLSEEERRPLLTADVNLVLGNRIQTLSFNNAEKLDPSLWIDINQYQWQETYSYSTVETDDLIDLTDDSQDINIILGNAIPKPSDALTLFMRTSADRSASASIKNTANYKIAYFFIILFVALAIIAVAALFGVDKEQFLFRPLFFFIIMLLALAIMKIPRKTNKNVISSERIFIYCFIAGIAIISGLIYSGVINIQGPPFSKSTSYIIVLIIVLVMIYSFRKIIDLVYLGIFKLSALLSSGQDSQSVQQNSNIKERKQRASNQQLWRKWLSRLALVSKMSYLIGFRQAKHLNNILQLFEKGDLNEALRHALPVDYRGESLGQSFGVPKPRNKLTLSDKCYGSTGIYIDDEIQERLRQLYRQSFTKLDREGRVEEAVFVLVELLNVLYEGLEYLEKHQRYVQAMELAIARDASADTIVRLCCLADDWQRAIIIARRDNAFAGAVLLLEKKQSEMAKQLRLEWANTLVEQSEWLKAVEVVWPLTEQREKAKEWLKCAERAEGKLAAMALVKRVVLLPDTLTCYQDYIEKLRHAPEYYNERLAIANELLKETKNAKRLRGFAKLLLNMILNDHLQHEGGLSKDQLSELIKFSGDKLLSADLPDKSLLVKEQKPLDQLKNVQFWQAPASGMKAIFDAVPLYNGSYLLALGDAGAVIIDRYGKQIVHFMAPAHHIVLSDNRQQALMLARRDNVHRISKIDIVINKVTKLGTLAFDHYAKRFDGIHWSIVHENRVQVLDISGAFKIVWQVDHSPNKICQFDSTINSEEMVLQDVKGQYEYWRYTLPERRLIDRRQFDDVRLSANSRCLLNPGNGVIFVHYNKRKKAINLNDAYVLDCEIAMPNFNEDKFQRMPMAFGHEWLTMLPSNDGESEYSIPFYKYMGFPELRLKATISGWPMSAIISIRNIEYDWLIFDDEGRLFHLNIDTSQAYQISVT